ncbi:MAG: precorrin-2 C(20)-methyltransferase [Alphaproteobacteria bacterium]|jgi:precorrin-2/cobalt-factor-2 C20-methyltransferase|nr:precorrin-2 C(20)-methyltransferase [Alphaproteobacteria bacterium]MDP7172536.1 precorrin-2 C(20)-methyltransferase [Alphaproteobacteria bacterium]MDP7234520.1 precorrin-2 C(20)-methyltransferase [Alphaproteobacteria bacterium]MDP7486590.1 precorrin-2 C(20)-methyltransferase [Alphaproteobacteria bacterium]MEE1543096.1 precorrin-2 C(20)-methyltransferase [Alphaproteobacteria bacterium]
MSGTVYGLGVGPGDPELLTLKALRILQASPVLAFPAPETGESLTRAIVATHLPAGQREIAIRVPMVASRFPAHEVYDQAAEEIADIVAGGKDVAVLCEGDPFLYGSFMYLFARLADHCPVEVVPGVSSLTAAACRLGVPLTSRNDVLAVIPAPLKADALAARLAVVEAAAIVKLSRHFAKVRQVLDHLGLTAQARYIERATMADERALLLTNVDPDKVPYFSMILVHRRGEAWR